MEMTSTQVLHALAEVRMQILKDVALVGVSLAQNKTEDVKYAQHLLRELRQIDDVLNSQERIDEVAGLLVRLQSSL